MQNNIFVVSCERIKHRSFYYVRFDANDQLSTRIKELSEDSRKWNSGMRAWEISIGGLLKIIKFYRGSNKIKFDFGSMDARNLFAKQIQKIEAIELEKERKINELRDNRENWLNYKLELEKNYLEYNDLVHSFLKEGIKLYPHQIIASLFLNRVRSALISHEMGTGKAQPLDSKILTPNGWVRMGDITAGNYVIGSDGKPKLVEKIYPQGLKDIYEIKFSDGTITQSCDEHLWNVNTYIRNWRNNSFLTKTLREIIDGGLQFKNGNNKWYIPIIKPIEFEEKVLNINPYVLGCLLGDGGITNKYSVSFTSIDQEILDNISSRLPDNHNLVRNGNSSLAYYLNSDGKNNYINQHLKKYNLKGCSSHTKFIPNDFMFGSINQRLELLQGILDTDGHANKRDGFIELTLASKELINNVQFIVESLGGIGRIHDKWVLYNGERRIYYRISIKLPIEFIPFKLERKINSFKSPIKYFPNRAIINIKYVGKKEAQCIVIDSNDHLYCTDNCILTHNSLSSIVYAEMNNFEKIIVVTPNSLKYNYFNEVDKFTRSKAHIINKRKNKYNISESKYIIFNYEYFNPSDKAKFKAKWKKLEIGKIGALIFDECQALKSTGSNTYKNIKSLFVDDIFVDNKPSRVFLSGTPAPNRAHELFSVLNMINVLDFPTKKYFNEYYCGMSYDFNNGWGWVSGSAEQKLEELYHKISPYTHRVLKKNVLKDLPDKTYQRLIIEMNDIDQKTYNEVEEGVANEFLTNPTSNPLTIMLRLRQYTAHVKSLQIQELIDTILESGEKVVIVDVFKESLKYLKEKYGDIACLHTGDVSVEDRAAMVVEFQNPDSKIKIFLGSIQTCNYGLTLTAASKLIILTLPFSVGQYDQVSDRLHRISQKDAVNIYVPIFEETIDDYVYSTIESKRKEITKVMDNVNYESETDSSVIGEVMNLIKNKYKK